MRAWKKNPTPFAWTKPATRSSAPIVECSSTSRRRCTSRLLNAAPGGDPVRTTHPARVVRPTLGPRGYHPRAIPVVR
jgi:hypothetical protein